jgi:nucleotidyltransferase substrate binding protein (TIGR01987 family)
LTRLGEALQIQNPNPLYIDDTIQRFEVTLELFWKTLKRLLAQEGIETNTPKNTLKESFKIGWLHDETAWLQMLEDCNQTSHVDDEEMAKRIYHDIQKYFSEMQKVFLDLKKRV